MSLYTRELESRPLVLDGAMGTMIYQRGVFVNTCYDELALTRPDLVLGIHREYVEAGADLLLTNTFGGNRVKLRSFGLAEEVGRLNKAAVRLAREAAGDSEALVAGDVGPCLEFGVPLMDDAVPKVREAFEEQIGSLAEAGADLIFLETFGDLRELQLAAAVARAAGLPVHASFTVGEEGKSAVGFAAATFIDALESDSNVDSIGMNCGTGPGHLFALVEKLRQRVGKPLLVKPNAGVPREVGGRMLYMTSPEYFTEYAKRFVELGVRGVGGCCGTTPEHIRHAARAIKALSGIRERVVERVATLEEHPEVEVTPAGEKSRFAAKLLSGEEVTSVEVLPPRNPDLSGLLDKVEACRDAGVDVINIPDGPRASARVSPMIAAMLIESALGIETVPHYCCRDRNLLGMQSDILGAAAAGIRNLLVITGDTPKTGDHPRITGVFDIDSIGLTQMIASLNHGFDFGGNFVKVPTSMFVGVGVNPLAVDMEREIERYRRKLEAGAEYAITQPVFDADSLLRFLERLDALPRRIPVLAGVWPLVSYKNAEFMRNEVPGVVIPDAVMERLRGCGTREEAHSAGVDIAREVIRRLCGSVAGFQVSAPLGNTEIALRVLRSAE